MYDKMGLNGRIGMRGNSLVIFFLPRNSQHTEFYKQQFAVKYEIERLGLFGSVARGE